MQVREIFDTLPNTGDYAKTVEKLNEYFSPQTNIAYEVYNFRQTKHKDSESLDSYHTRLCQLAKTCEFSNIDTEIKEHIILTCSSNSLRCRALRENLTLDALFKLGRALELSEEQARQVEKAAADVNATETKGSDLPGRSRQRNELNTPRSHVSQDLSHAIVKSQTSETASLENVIFAADMLLTGIHVQPEENRVTPAGKLDILLMFAEPQFLLRKVEKWLLRTGC